MSPELPSQPVSLDAGCPFVPSAVSCHAEDQPVEAIVYEVHPALVQVRALRHRTMAYPYGPQAPASSPPGENPFHVRPQDIYRPPTAPLFQFDLTEAKADYVVPQRFGLAAILGMTTALAILFGCMRWLDAEPAWYLFYGFQSVVICIVQMFQGRSPRRASAIAGAILGPLFILGSAWFAPRQDAESGLVLCFMVMMIPCGAFLGYLNGACAAGIFLVMDKAEKYLKSGSISESGAEGQLSTPAVPVP